MILFMRSGSMFCQPIRADGAQIDELCRFTRDKINDPQGGETERGEEDGTERHKRKYAQSGAMLQSRSLSNRPV